MAAKNSLRVAVIGAGPAGIATGHELLAQGFDQFTIFEKSDAVGGTWHQHSYPGLACDVWAHSYTFSYRPNPDWSASFVEQPEIEAYLQQCATEFGLDPHIRLNTRITAATFNDGSGGSNGGSGGSNDGSSGASSGSDGGFWTLTSAGGETFEFDVIVNAMGNQHTPVFPDAPGQETFEGPSWHSTEWNHDVDLDGKNIVLVGSAAAAVQIVPEIAPRAGHLTVLQRTPNWIMPRGRVPYSESKRAWYRRAPFLIRITQKLQRFMMSFVHEAATLGHKRQQQFEDRARKFIEDTIPDPELREALTPDSRYACKRGLVSDDFYPALMRKNVELIPAGLEEVRPKSVVIAGGREIPADVIIYCTGYRILDFDRIDIVGSKGVSLADAMGDEPEAYKGIAAPDFPNYFFAVGPNGLVLNVPYFITVERNVETIVRLLNEKEAAGAKAIVVKDRVNRDYNDWALTQFGLYSWGASSCNSYYRLDSGRAPFLFPGDFKTYTQMHDEIRLDDFEVA